VQVPIDDGTLVFFATYAWPRVEAVFDSVSSLYFAQKGILGGPAEVYVLLGEKKKEFLFRLLRKNRAGDSSNTLPTRKKEARLPFSTRPPVRR